MQVLLVILMKLPESLSSNATRDRAFMSSDGPNHVLIRDATGMGHSAQLPGAAEQETHVCALSCPTQATRRDL